MIHGKGIFLPIVKFCRLKKSYELGYFRKKAKPSDCFFKDMDGVLFEHEELQIVSISSKNSNILHSCFWRSAFLKAQDWVVEDTLKMALDSIIYHIQKYNTDIYIYIHVLYIYLEHQ